MIIRTSVVLPAPLAPITPTIAPGGNRAARQPPDQPTTLWMVPSSTGVPRLRSALSASGYRQPNRSSALDDRFAIRKPTFAPTILNGRNGSLPVVRRGPVKGSECFLPAPNTHPQATPELPLQATRPQNTARRIRLSPMTKSVTSSALRKVSWSMRPRIFWPTHMPAKPGTQASRDRGATSAVRMPLST